jgi:ribosomal protein L37AE/L43A
MINVESKQAVEPCPECGESRERMLSITPVWFECKSCGYTEDAFKGPVSTLGRQADTSGPLVQYM